MGEVPVSIASLGMVGWVSMWKWLLLNSYHGG